MAKEDNVLTEDFLFELYYACFTYDYVCSLVCEYMQKSYLPGRDFKALQGYLCKYFAEHKSSPTLNIISQIVSVNREVSALLEDIKDCAEGVEPEIILEQFENYLRQVKFQKTYKEIGELYAKQDRDKAMKLLQSFAEWQNDFSLRQNSFVDVVETFESRFRRNREKHNQESRFKPITRFYIDGLDEMNGGRDLRTQLTCLLAPTGVGKSHAARWIGKFLYLQFKQSYILIINLRNLMLIQLGNTKGQEILRKARFSCQKGENYGEFNEGAEKSQGHAVPDAVQHKGESAESVQCSESFAL